MTIRPARVQDSPTLREIERAAGERFRDVGLSGIADDEPLPAPTLDRYATEGRSWVALDDADRPIGYVVVDVIDDHAHIEQVSVHPDHQGRGVGRALLNRVRGWASDTGLSMVTLTTFSDVPWNRPLYEHVGFTVMPEESIGPQLKALRLVEAEHGLDPDRRVCMQLRLST